ncbi:MAG: hypothetical protein Q8P24_16505 [Desulfobacterales bacterium]|nr:hypothetical protein [Desulfobacterales bacterium]
MSSSFIWRVKTERMGSLEPFKSEYDMEAFLMNNPSIICGENPADESMPPALIRQQLSTRKGSRDAGRIDLVALVHEEKGPVLKIFELKQGQVTTGSVKQLVDYLDGWSNEESAKNAVEKWLTDMSPGRNDVAKLLEAPKGVLVGPSFHNDAIAAAVKHKLEGMRLTRFRHASSDEYFVIVEDQVGDVVKEVDPNLQRIVDAYNCLPQDGLSSTGRARKFRQVRVPNWNNLLHYEFHLDGDSAFVALDIEQKDLDWLADKEEVSGCIVALKKCFPNQTVSFPDKQFRYGIRLSIAFNKNDDPEVVARGMGQLIQITKPLIETALNQQCGRN